jgi:hypothetical protein
MVVSVLMTSCRPLKNLKTGPDASQTAATGMTASPNPNDDPAQRVTVLEKASKARETGCAFAQPGVEAV